MMSYGRVPKLNSGKSSPQSLQSSAGTLLKGANEAHGLMSRDSRFFKVWKYEEVQRVESGIPGRFDNFQPGSSHMLLKKVLRAYFWRWQSQVIHWSTIYVFSKHILKSMHALCTLRLAQVRSPTHAEKRRYATQIKASIAARC